MDTREPPIALTNVLKSKIDDLIRRCLKEGKEQRWDEVKTPVGGKCNIRVFLQNVREVSVLAREDGTLVVSVVVDISNGPTGESSHVHWWGEQVKFSSKRLGLALSSPPIQGDVDFSGTLQLQAVIGSGLQLQHEWVRPLVLVRSDIDVSWLCDTYLFPRIKATVQDSFAKLLSDLKEALTLDEVAFREAPNEEIIIMIRPK